MVIQPFNDLTTMFLIINTATIDKITIALARKSNLVAKRSIKTRFHESEKLLSNIYKILEENKFKFADLEGIVVVGGPGPFTSLRIGIVIANVLAFTLGIPVAGVADAEVKKRQKRKREEGELKALVAIGFRKLKKARRGRFVLPFYGRAPHITRPLH